MEIHDPRIPVAEAGGISTVHCDNLGQKQWIEGQNDISPRLLPYTVRPHGLKTCYITWWTATKEECDISDLSWHQGSVLGLNLS